MKPFGEFAAERFIFTRPELRAHRVLIEETAWVYLFRFDRHLTTDFIHDAFRKLASRVADTVGWSVEESRRVTLSSFHYASRLYFSAHWDKLNEFVDKNSPALWNIRRQLTLRLDHAQRYMGSEENAVQQVNEDMLGALEAKATRDHPLLLKVYADYCTRCAEIGPEFEAAARSLITKATFVSLNGPENVPTVRRHGVQSYPTILRFDGPSRSSSAYPTDRPVLAHEIIQFAITPTAPEEEKEIAGRNLRQLSVEATNGLRLNTQVSMNAASISAENDRDAPGGMLGQWANMLRRQGIDELEALVRDRDAAVHSRIDHALRCHDIKCCLPPPKYTDPHDAPVAILLGGGMGSGKTSVVEVLARTEFWRNRGASAVVVEADAFKLTDPVFTALASLGVTKAAGIVHRKSLEGAEELLLLATQKRRDIVFDGTMAWKPFVEQTIAMLKDPDHFYVRGPGYVNNGDGTLEEYWVRTAKRDTPVVPYRIEIVGVSIDASLAVERAIIRSIATGRSVPVREQLESHRRFSMHFEEYVAKVDAAYLFDMSAEDEAPCSADSTPVRGLVASKAGRLFPKAVGNIFVGDLAILNLDAFKRFQRKKYINVNSSSNAELYKEEKSGISMGRE